MSGENIPPRKMWFTPLPNKDNPRTGGGLMHILPAEGDRVTVGLDLARLLSLQRAVAHLVEIVVQNSLPRRQETENPITEEEILAVAQLLDGDLTELFNTNTEKKEDEDNG